MRLARWNGAFHALQWISQNEIKTTEYFDNVGGSRLENTERIIHRRGFIKKRKLCEIQIDGKKRHWRYTNRIIIKLYHRTGPDTQLQQRSSITASISITQTSQRKLRDRENLTCGSPLPWSVGCKALTYIHQE